MRPLRAKITIDRPVADVFEYLLDIAARPEYAPDLFLDFRLTRVASRGVGAGARFRLHGRLRDRFAGTTIVSAVPGELVLEEGSTGRGGRVPLVIEYRLEELAGGITRVQAGLETRPGNPADKLREFGLRRRVKTRLPRAMRRLRDVLERSPNARPGDRPTVAGVGAGYVPNP